MKKEKEISIYAGNNGESGRIYILPTISIVKWEINDCKDVYIKFLWLRKAIVINITEGDLPF